MRVLVLVGVPGAGKTFLSKRLASCGWCYISQDELGSRPACEDAFRVALRRGQHVVVDRCNIDDAQRAHWVRLVYDSRVPGVSLLALQLLVPLELCKDRARRLQYHPTLGQHNCDAVIDRFAREFTPVRPSEGFGRVITVHSSGEAEQAVEQLLAEAEPAGGPHQAGAAPNGWLPAPQAPAQTLPHSSYYAQQQYDRQLYDNHQPRGSDSYQQQQQSQGQYHHLYAGQQGFGYEGPNGNPRPQQQQQHGSFSTGGHQGAGIPVQQVQGIDGAAQQQHYGWPAQGGGFAQQQFGGAWGQPGQPYVLAQGGGYNYGGVTPDGQAYTPEPATQQAYGGPLGSSYPVSNTPGAHGGGQAAAYQQQQWGDLHGGGSSANQRYGSDPRLQNGAGAPGRGPAGQKASRWGPPATAPPAAWPPQPQPVQAQAAEQVQLRAQAEQQPWQDRGPTQQQQRRPEWSEEPRSGALGAAEADAEPQPGYGYQQQYQQQCQQQYQQQCLQQQQEQQEQPREDVGGRANGHDSERAGGYGRGSGPGRGGSSEHKDIVRRLRLSFADPSSRTPYDSPSDSGAAADPRVIVLFDLNGTLTSHTSVRKAQGITRVRPGTDHLLRLRQHFRLGIYTSATVRTAQTAMEMLEQAAGGELFERRLLLHREHTTPAPPGHVDTGGDPWDTLKPLARYFTSMHRVLLVDDDSYKSIKGEEANMLVVPCWRDEDTDCPVLRLLSDLLLSMAAQLPQDADVRLWTSSVSSQLHAAAVRAPGQ